MYWTPGKDFHKRYVFSLHKNPVRVQGDSVGEVAAKPNNPSLIPGTDLMVEETKLSSDLTCAQRSVCVCADVHREVTEKVRRGCQMSWSRSYKQLKAG